MPERDFDKVLREKLQGYKADYNSADWEQMETMLPQQSRTRYYATAALLLLLLGFAGLWVGMNGFNRQQSDVIVQHEAAGKAAEPVAEREQLVEETTFNTTQRVEQVTPQAISGTGNASAESNATISEIRAHDKVFGKTDKPKTSVQEERKLTVRTYSKGGVETTVTESNRVIEDGQRASSGLAQVNNDIKEAEAVENRTLANSDSGENTGALHFSDNTIVNQDARTVTQFTSRKEVALEFSESSESGFEETASVFALNAIESGLIRSNENEEALTVKDALNGDALPSKKPKKQIVSFVIGAGAGMNFSFTDPALITKPGYAVNIAQELMFVKRIGIALTQSYAERKYDGGAYPCPEGVMDCPNAYSSTVRSVDFGIALKANLVNKTKWNWYVKAGVVNVVKNKELFSYSYPQIDTVTPPPTLPSRTNFNGTTTEVMFDNMSFGLSSDPVYAPDLTISGAKRYHVAYHAATGFDVAINSRMKVQVEAGHSFTQPTVGADDRRLHSFGINAGVLYRLGN